MAEYTVDIPYCASSFLMHRTIRFDRSKCFSPKHPPRLYPGRSNCEQIHDSAELKASLERQVREACADGKAALALSGGIDSAVLASFMPKGSKAYSFKCVVPGMQVTDETPNARRYAEHFGLDHEIVEITWEDVERVAVPLMLHKGAPIHSIETQIYLAALKAKEDGFERFIFGESADLNYGGLSGLLSQDWTFGQYVERFSFVMPYVALKDYRMELGPFIANCKDDGYINVREHHRNEFLEEAMGSYENATSFAGIELVTPYANTWMACDLDMDRIRSGDGKYLIREVFAQTYPGWDIPAKLPMPRPMDQWMDRWEGPTRQEFWPNCTQGMTGDQKWLIWALERFLNALDEE